MPQFWIETVWLVPCYSLLGALLTIPWSPGILRRTGPRPAGYINLLMTFFSFIHSAIALSKIWGQPAQQISLPWLQVANLDLTLPLELSALSIGAMALVTGLNFSAQLYAVGYMEMDWGWARFFGFLAFFEAGMCALVLCNSLFFSFMILEILTLGTYVLVGLWFSQSLVVSGARDAFLTKRVGDLLLLMGLLALLPLAGTWNFTELAQWAESNPQLPTGTATLLGLALIAGPMGKCAQFPLHLWLDEAMEGPLPSTILRNSVVVATGAWVLIKLEPVLALSPAVLTTAIAIGAVSAVGGTLIAIAQIDVKRALSYSVSAYMGLVFIAVGTQQDEAALLLVLIHALAMALLVMSTGTIVWSNITQDLTLLGGLWSRRPISGIAYIAGTLALIGFPPLGGFWALLKLLDGLWDTNPLLVVVVLLVNTLTAFSLTREFGLIFGGKPKPMTVRAPEVLWPMVIPMTLALGVVLHLPLILLNLDLLPDWAALNKDAALVLTWSSILGLSLGAVVYLSPLIQKPIKLPVQALQQLLAADFYTPQIYRSTIVLGVATLSRIADWVDRFIVDGFINAVGWVSIFGGESLKYGNSGQSQSYLLTIVVGMSILGLVLAWSILPG
ncbi:NAD(P)H-quinone oxidoreductase subunit F [Altericista sp. CCNU0014]|uniref:NAD(P)H-quinone oxidoreductase subunit F n=1 Tax=Altericista sp. CCNU0014 TaxID=3082949 RepID=UPI003850F000